MNSITVHIPALLKKIQEMASHNMVNVKMTICDKAIDQDSIFPAFLNLEAYTEDGFIEDYESIDSIMFYIPPSQSAPIQICS